MGNLALALLAQDKYMAVTNPVEYMAAEKHPVRRLSVAVSFVLVALGIRLLGEVNYIHGWINFTWMNLNPYQTSILFGDGIRTVYSFYSIYT